MRMKKIISGILLSLVMVLMAGASSLANIEYNLWVGGTRVTNGNADDIPAKNGTREGTASYDAESNVLTLNNYRYEGTGKFNPFQRVVYSPIYSEITDGITIKLVGNNSLINTASLDESKEIYGVYSETAMTIEGPGVLYVKGGNTNGTSYGIYMGGGGEIENATVKVDAGNSTGNSSASVGIRLSRQKVSIKNANITANGGTGYNSYGLEIWSNLEIKDNNTFLQATGGHASGTGNNSQSTGIFVNGTGASFTVSGGTVIASGNTYGIRTTGNLTVNSADSFVARGDDKAIEGTIKNAMGGNGWTDKEGTTGRTNIPSSPGGQTLNNYKKVEFPFEPATVTRNPEANSLTYTGAAQKLVTAGMATNGTMQYTLGTNATTAPTSGYTTSIPEKTDAGTYYVWYKAVGNASAGYSDTDPVCIPVTIKANGNYSYVSGAQGTWQKESSEVMSFHIKHTGNDEKTFNKFTGIQVDGKPVDKNKYEAKPGSVIINLKPTFLETLSVGEHKLNVVFEDGNVETTFSIIQANLPQTGDTQNPLLYVVVAVIGLAGIGFIRKKI